ncbi:MAG: thiamine pyrophosphate-dependent enzyme [Chloroflexota bacterium]|nr:thiamine pyrophosphate-dependent enzyme [Chloroflexota bacterium]
MPKSILIDPTIERRADVLRAPEIPLNAYVSDPVSETALYGTPALVGIYRDMLLIREFETLLEKIKKEGSSDGIVYNHKGPAHLSIGQEATVVGQCFHLDVNDHTFGSHRSHGEILAKSFSAIRRLSDPDLMQIMESYFGGAALRVVERFAQDSAASDLALDYTLYGALAEIFGRAAGFNRGMGGSMHAFFPPFGVMPNNAIVGGSAPIATGAALYKRVNRRPGIVIANIGDAALGTGAAWESMIFAAMDQYRTLWDADLGGGLPIIFNFMNNFYGMGGQPVGETMGVGVLARAGLGINAEGMHAERVDGYNPLAVADAIARKRRILAEGRGPVLLDTITYRFSGHSPSDASSYRERAEIELWREQDPLVAYRAYLIEHGHAAPDALDTLRTSIVDRLRRAAAAAVSLDESPRLIAGWGTDDAIGALMFADELRARFDERTPEVLLPLDQTRLATTHAKARFGLDADGMPLPRTKCLTFAEALFEAMIDGFYSDPTMIAYGEENRDWGGAFGVYRGLTEALPYHRLFNSPISEAAIVGTAVGYALSGGRVVAELMYCDFMGRAGDEIFNQMAKWRAMSGGLLPMPLVLRVSVGAKYGAQHSQDWSSLAAHIPGLQVMFPATAYDAKGMLALALQGSDPVVFFESQRLYTEPETLVPGGVPIERYTVALGAPAIRRAGDDLTVVTIGAALYRALDAAAILERDHGLGVEVIDARFLAPLDLAPLVESARKTGRIAFMSDACERGSFLHTLASQIGVLAFDALDAPPLVVGARNWITPPAEMEESFFPGASWLIDAVHERLLPLPGHVPTTVQTDAELLRRSRGGV